MWIDQVRLGLAGHGDEMSWDLFFFFFSFFFFFGCTARLEGS